MKMEIEMETVVKRFRDYISFNTQSDETNDKECPSTPGQMVLAKHLAEELRAIGLTEVTVDEHAYVMATLPANNGGGAPVVGFIESAV
ncbi:MAG TPA: peptidase T, partial [Mitsuokella multacida]|nr:peptidase T [Mitsuokella multacida]